MGKHIGDVAEMSFMLRAKKSGFAVLTPYSSGSTYDLVVDSNGKLSRVQVKATNTVHSTNISDYYRIVCSHGSAGKKLYTKEMIDFFAFYIMPLDLFYVIPVGLITTKNIKLYPDKSNHKYSKYLENFNILKK